MREYENENMKENPYKSGAIKVYKPKHEWNGYLSCEKCAQWQNYGKRVKGKESHKNV